MIKLEIWSFCLLCGVCFPHWTIASQLKHGNCIVDIENGTLKGVNATSNSTDIDLSGLQIKRIGRKAFDGLTNIKSLNLSNNKIRELPGLIFSKLKNLEQLSLANNKLYSLHYAFTGLNNLKRLNLSYTETTKLGDGDLFGLTKSTEIIIEENRFHHISSNLFEDQSTHVHSFDNTCEQIVPSLEEEPNAVEPLSDDFKVKLCKSNDSLVKSVEELKQNETLDDCMKVKINRRKRSLYLSNLGLKEFQRGWYKLPGDSIRKLHLSNNYIRDITPELLNDLPPGLSSIDLTFNNITIIKKGIIENRYFRKLRLENNFLSTIEDGAFENTNLTLLNAGKNRLDSLAFVSTLPKSLEQLKLVGNSITDIPINTFRGLENLRLIDLAENHVEKLETGVFEDQKNLLNLDLNGNRISELNSGSFKGLKMLNKLILSVNEIEKISKHTFSELRSSNFLVIDLEKNKINAIEEGAFSNMNITWLILSNNRIVDESIAKGSFNACTLCVLDLDNNLITKINEDSFHGVLKMPLLNFAGNNIASIKKLPSEPMKSVRKLDLSKNPLERLENGALYGLSKSPSVTVIIWGTPIKYIDGGVFDRSETSEPFVNNVTAKNVTDKFTFNSSQFYDCYIFNLFSCLYNLWYVFSWI